MRCCTITLLLILLLPLHSVNGQGFGDLGRAIQQQMLDDAAEAQRKENEKTPQQRKAEERKDEKLAMECPPNSAMRAWTINGTHTVGKPVKISPQSLWIKTKSGEVMKGPRAGLNERDQGVVSGLEKKMKAAEQAKKKREAAGTVNQTKQSLKESK